MMFAWIQRYKVARIERYKKEIETLVMRQPLTKKQNVEGFLYTDRCQENVVVVKKEADVFTLTLVRVWTTEETSAHISYQKTHTKELWTETIQKGHALFRKVEKEYRSLHKQEKEQIEQGMHADRLCHEKRTTCGVKRRNRRINRRKKKSE